MTIVERLQIAILAADQIEREPGKVTFTEQRARNIKKQLLAISAELKPDDGPRESNFKKQFMVFLESLDSKEFLELFAAIDRGEQEQYIEEFVANKRERIGSGVDLNQHLGTAGRE